MEKKPCPTIWAKSNLNSIRVYTSSCSTMKLQEETKGKNSLILISAVADFERKSKASVTKAKD